MSAATANAITPAVGADEPTTAAPSLRLRTRSCPCGEAAGLTGACGSCDSVRLMAARVPGAPTAAAHVPPVVHDVLRGSGQPLSAATRRSMEPRIGHDFSNVRVHTGSLADLSARSVHSLAFTVGHNVVFRQGQYAPGTPSGDRVLGHELTHVVQQSGARTDQPLVMGPPHDAHERAANATATSLTATPNRVATPTTRLQRLTVQRIGETAPPVSDASQQQPAPAEPGFWDRITGNLSSIIEEVVPKPVLALVRAIRSKGGILGYLKDLLSGAFGGIFGRLSAGGGFIADLIAGFSKLADSAKTIISALARGDCKPLFDAVGLLSDMLQKVAGDAWDSVKAFFAPIGDFFSGLWQKFGAPVLSFLNEFASDIWNDIKDLGQSLWAATQPLRNKLSAAWSAAKHLLGIGDAPDEQDGLVKWAQTKLGEAWGWVVKQLDPVIQPMKALAAKIAEIVPLSKIIHLRDAVHEWLQHAGDMVKSLQKPKGITEDQKSLRDKVLPAIKASIVKLGGTIASAGDWVAAVIGGAVQTVIDLFDSLRHNSIVGAFAGALGWIEDGVKSLDRWVEGGVKALFGVAGEGVAKLSGFVDPVLSALEKLVSIAVNVVKALPDLVGGPFWKLIPDCIKEPIKQFVIEHILSQIPVVSTFVKLPDIWKKIQKLVMDFLTTVFVKGDLGGAALMVIRFVLEAAGVDFDLFLSVLADAASTLDDLIMHPVQFLKNLFAALFKGTKQFLANIGKHIISALLEWILEPLGDIGVVVPKQFTLATVFDLALQILGISGDKLHAKLEAAIGPTATAILTEAWKWISSLITGGLSGLWEQIKARVGDLWGMIIGGISEWITTNIVTAGLEKLVELSNPVGGVIEAIQTIYAALKTIATQVNKILRFVKSVTTSIDKIVKGDIGDAANKIEDALSKTLAPLISFLAEWLKISNPGERIKNIVLNVRERIDNAINWLIDKAVGIGRGLFGGGKDKEEDENPNWAPAVAGVNAEIDELKKNAPEGQMSEEVVEQKLPEWKVKYGFSSLTGKLSGGELEIDGGMSPSKKVTEVAVVGAGSNEGNAIEIPWFKPALADYEPIMLARPEKPEDLKRVLPTETKTLGNSVTIGVQKKYQVASGGTFEVPKIQLPTPRDPAVVRTFNAELKRWGYDRNDNLSSGKSTDADHVVELQLGGADKYENLWPLDSSQNRSSGPQLNAKLAPFQKLPGGLSGRWIKFVF